MQKTRSSRSPFVIGAVGALALMGTVSVPPVAAATATTFFVSPTGSDAASGRSVSEPFRSLERARDAARDVVGGGMTGDVLIRLRGGTYYQAETLTLDARDSGTGGHEVIWTSYANEVPRIVGGRRLTDWTAEGNGVFSSPLAPRPDGTPWTFSHLVEGDRNAIPARFPNLDPVKLTPTYLTNGSAGASSSGLTYARADAAALDGLPVGAQVVTWAGGPRNGKWFASTVPVAGVDPVQRRITFARPTTQPVKPESFFFVQGSRAFLDQEGEFHLDREAARLYYRPRAADIDRANIVAPTVQDVISVRGTPTDPAHDIRISRLLIWASDIPEYFQEVEKPYTGTDFGALSNGKVKRGSVWNRPADRNLHGLIRIENATGIVIESNNLGHGGLSGVVLAYGARGNVVRGNDLHGLGYFGVMMVGAKQGAVGPDGVQILDNHDNVIDSNVLRQTGTRVGHGGGVFINQSARNTVTHNRFMNSPRYGVVVKGSTFDEMPRRDSAGVAITLANYHDYLTSRENVISWNDLTQLMLDSTDGGFLSTRGTGRDNVLRSNRVELGTDPTADTRLVRGIFLDDESDGFTIESNVVHGSAMAAVQLRGWDDLLRNNVLVQRDPAAPAVKIAAGSVSRSNARAAHRLERNLVVSPAFAFGWTGNWEPERVLSSDHNLFWAGSGSYRMEDMPGIVDLAAWRKANSGRYDQNSLAADPLFVDPDSGDFRVRQGSPAFGLGFQQVDLSAAGPSAGFAPAPTRY